MAYDNLMLDLETLGTAHDAVITQIGACYFDPTSGAVDENGKFSINVSINDCLKYGLTVDEGSIKFWFEHPNRSFLDKPVSLARALGEFRKFYRKDTVAAWSHATFDFVILLNAYRKFDQKIPIPFRQMRDIRTLVHLADAGKPTEAKKTVDPKTHDALEDCIYQVGYVTEALNKLVPVTLKENV